MKKQRVFCYGTLKRGMYFHNRYLGEGKSNYVGTAVTTKDWSLFLDGLPHMIKEDSPNGVKGELYEVDDDVLKSLDDLEGVPVVYKREIVELFDEEKKPILAWAYIRPPHFKGRLSAYKEETGIFE